MRKIIFFIFSLFLSFTFAQTDDFQSLSKEEKRQRILEKFDKNGDGKLSPRERRHLKKWKTNRQRRDINDDGTLQPWERKVNKNLLEKFDSDGDGQLSPAERAKYRQSGRFLDRNLDKPRDFNDDGQVSRWEKMTDAQLRDNFDTNGDGKLTGSELGAYRKARAKVDLRRNKAAHQRKDLNDDGKIGAKEREINQNLRERADRNDDGKLNHRERKNYRQSQRRTDRRVGRSGRRRR